MPFLSAPVCDRYGTPFSHEIGEGALSARAIADPPVFNRARACVAYEGQARSLVTAFKFGRRRELAEPMGQWMARVARELIAGGPQDAASSPLVIPVPLHWTRLWSRRFNQASELARVVAREMEAEWEPMLLMRRKRTRQQVGLDMKSRSKNVRGAFAVRGTEAAVLQGRSVLLVDDVMTTGSTISACTRALLSAGAAEVNVLTFAIALDENTAY